MVGTIVPMVHGKNRPGSVYANLGVYTVGSTLGGGTLGISLSLLGRLVGGNIGHDMTPLIALAAILYSFHEAGICKLPTPQFRRQVPASWRVRMPTGLATLCYGFSLGTGIGTRIPVTTFYVLVFLAATCDRKLLGI